MTCTERATGYAVYPVVPSRSFDITSVVAVAALTDATASTYALDSGEAEAGEPLWICRGRGAASGGATVKLWFKKMPKESDPRIVLAFPDEVAPTTIQIIDSDGVDGTLSCPARESESRASGHVIAGALLIGTLNIAPKAAAPGVDLAGGGVRWNGPAGFAAWGCWRDGDASLSARING
ncbi:MAG: hypothetical protein JOZ69_22900, partial [Myxococcales bacterium]|nr:hypothetical protein [Myxococcales bacterium]